MDDSSSQPEWHIERSLRASEYFLSNRNFDGCRKYALRAQEHDPNIARAAHLLAVADVLAASETHITNDQPDWYAILLVTRYSEDLQLIRSQFENLNLRLNPIENKFAFAEDAFKLVHDAWAVLSNPSKKSRFDNELKIFESQSEPKQQKHHQGHGESQRTRSEGEMKGKCGSGDETFWTICPYCYYMYEYPRVYEDCCLRCQNQNCERGYHAVVIPEPPPIEVVENGKYWCLGFFPLGFEGGEGKGFSSWTPFAPMFMGPSEVEVKEKNGVPRGANVDDTDSFIEISDDSDNPGDELGANNKGARKNFKTRAQTEEVKKPCGGVHGYATKSVQTEVPNVAKPAMKRKKSVAKNTKKLMGRGNRIGKRKTFPLQSTEGLDLNVEASKDDDDFGSGFVGGWALT
ncbi:hypothetical protein F0562_005468 [Nyssa sinensis]|uniref:J domain-containing protein n=1 Tax=Nyssa sinensis TaxID=561372 RepID=A0A5J5AKJ4_9ASTE|nr:hypothetical protein F0562_005468 [Nyssa sinensis]